MVVLAQEEARTLKHDYIGTEHILLGLVRVNKGLAARMLLDFGADSEDIRHEVILMLAGQASPRGSASAAGRPDTTRPAVPGPATGQATFADLTSMTDDELEDALEELLVKRRMLCDSFAVRLQRR